jgi:isocitrate dehydrogenase (NAD+)
MLSRATRLKQKLFTKCRSYATMPKKTVTLIPGDGVGPELCASVVELFRYAQIPIRWETFLVKGTYFGLGSNDALNPTTSVVEDRFQQKPSLYSAVRKQALSSWDPEIHYPDLHESIIKNKVVLKGPFFTPVGKGHTSIERMLAMKYNLYAHVVPVSKPPGFPTNIEVPFRDMDAVVVRENTEAEFSGIEHAVVPGVVESLKVITREKSTLIAKYAFEFAKRTKRDKVIAVHKANIIKMGDGLFLKCCREVSEEHPEVDYTEMIVDNTAMQLVKNPHQFNNSVIVTTNLYGSLVSNIAVALVGGPGVVGGWNEGSDILIFEQGARHVAADIAGLGVANPTGILLSSIDMLRHLQLNDHADRIYNALKDTYSDPAHKSMLTMDIGGTANTQDFISAIIKHLK